MGTRARGGGGVSLKSWEELGRARKTQTNSAAPQGKKLHLWKQWKEKQKK